MLELHEYLVLLVLNSLVCLGFYAACNYEIDVRTEKPTRDMILWWVKYYGEKLPWISMKPICGCMTCMASVHGLYFFLPAYELWGNEKLGWWLIPLYILYVFALAGLNTLLYRIYGDSRPFIKSWGVVG